MQLLKNCQAITGIELLLYIGILIILSSVTTPYLLKTREKNNLLSMRDKVVEVMETQKQNSIGAYQENTFSITFDLAKNNISLMPQDETVEMAKPVEIADALPFGVSFAKLTGIPSSEMTITLQTTNFKTEITMNDQGTIEIYPIENK